MTILSFSICYHNFQPTLFVIRWSTMTVVALRFCDVFHTASVVFLESSQAKHGKEYFPYWYASEKYGVVRIETQLTVWIRGSYSACLTISARLAVNIAEDFLLLSEAYGVDLPRFIMACRNSLDDIELKSSAGKRSGKTSVSLALLRLCFNQDPITHVGRSYRQLSSQLASFLVRLYLLSIHLLVYRP